MVDNMADEIISIGNKIELNVLPDKDKKKHYEQITYVSQILDFEDDMLVVALPIHEGHLIALHEESELECYFYTQKGIFKAMTVIRSRYKDGNVYMMKIELLSELKKFQRRQYFRLPCNIHVSMLPLDVAEVLDYSSDNVVPEKPESEWINGVIVDISGGGVRIFSGRDFEKNDSVLIRFSIDMNVGTRQIDILTRVVMSIKSPNAEDYYDNRLQYRNVPENTRDAIVKYIFEQQRKNQSRGR